MNHAAPTIGARPAKIVVSPRVLPISSGVFRKLRVWSSRSAPSGDGVRRGRCRPFSSSRHRTRVQLPRSESCAIDRDVVWGHNEDGLGLSEATAPIARSVGLARARGAPDIVVSVESEPTAASCSLFRALVAAASRCCCSPGSAITRRRNLQAGGRRLGSNG